MAERKKIKQKPSPFRERSPREKEPDLDSMFPNPDERTRVDDLVDRLAQINGVEGLFFGSNREGRNRKLYIVTRGGSRGEDPKEPSASMVEEVTAEFDQVFSDKRSRWEIQMEIVTQIGLQKSNRDFEHGRGQIITSVWHKV